MRAVWGGGVKEVGKICAQSLLRGCLGKHEKKVFAEYKPTRKFAPKSSPTGYNGVPLNPKRSVRNSGGFFWGGGG